jgi:opacity protein-like surface antigen
MKGNLRYCLYLTLAVLTMPVCLARADGEGDATTGAPANDVDGLFHRGQWEPTVLSGPLFSPYGSPRARPTINYILGGAQLGYMLDDPRERKHFFRGNFELVPEGFGAWIFGGEGHYISGGTLWLRYNIVPENSRWIPYFQAGGGFTLTDANRFLVGENFNFNVDGSLGLRYLIASHWTVNLEYRYQHISNADLSSRNVGINSQGPVLGVSYFF